MDYFQPKSPFYILLYIVLNAEDHYDFVGLLVNLQHNSVTPIPLDIIVIISNTVTLFQNFTLFIYKQFVLPVKTLLKDLKKNTVFTIMCSCIQQLFPLELFHYFSFLSSGIPIHA